MNIRRLRSLPAFLVLTCIAAPLPAASADPYVLDGAEFFLSINVSKLFSATMVNRDLDKLRQLMKGQNEIGAELDAIGFNPFTDLHTLSVVGIPSQGPDQFLVIARGRFDFKKLIDWTRKMLTEHGELLTTVEERGLKFLALTPPGQAQPIYIGWPDSETIVASPVRDFIARAIDVGSGKAQASLNQPAADLSKALDNTKVVSFMALGSALKNTPHAEVMRHAIGSLDIDQGVHLAVAVTAKDANAAEQLAKTATEAVANGKRMLSLMSHGQKELAPIVLMLGAVKVTRNGDTVNIQGDLTQDTLTKPKEGRAPNRQLPSQRDPVRRPAPKRPLRGA